MSGRIRTIKPELLEDAKTAGLSHFEFRLFVSLLLLADDYGNLRASPGLVRGIAFWALEDVTEEEIAIAIVELEELRLVETYTMRGQLYAHINGWSKHQRVDKPGKPRVPSLKDPEVRPARPWVTYFIQLGDDGPIKIGRTFDVEARLKKLQTSAPGKLHVLRVLKADRERELHTRFVDLCEHGEWFSPAQELLDFIAKESFANDSRTAPEPLAPDLRSPITDPDPEGDLTHAREEVAVALEEPDVDQQRMATNEPPALDAQVPEMWLVQATAIVRSSCLDVDPRASWRCYVLRLNEPEHHAPASLARYLRWVQDDCSRAARVFDAQHKREWQRPRLVTRGLQIPLTPPPQTYHAPAPPPPRPSDGNVFITGEAARAALKQAGLG